MPQYRLQCSAPCCPAHLASGTPGAAAAALAQQPRALGLRGAACGASLQGCQPHMVVGQVKSLCVQQRVGCRRAVERCSHHVATAAVPCMPLGLQAVVPTLGSPLSLRPGCYCRRSCWEGAALKQAGWATAAAAAVAVAVAVAWLRAVAAPHPLCLPRGLLRQPGPWPEGWGQGGRGAPPAKRLGQPNEPSEPWTACRGA